MKAAGLSSLCISWSWKSNWAMIQAGSLWIVWEVMRGKQASPQVEFKQKKCISIHFRLIWGFISPANSVCHVLGCISFYPDPGRIWGRRQSQMGPKGNAKCATSGFGAESALLKGIESWGCKQMLTLCAGGGWHCWGQPRCHPPCLCLCPRPNLDPSLT